MFVCLLFLSPSLENWVVPWAFRLLVSLLSGSLTFLELQVIYFFHFMYLCGICKCVHVCVQTFIPVHTGEGEKKTWSGLHLPNSLDTGSLIETEVRCFLASLAPSPSNLTFLSLIPYLNQDPRCAWLFTEVSGIWTRALRLLWQGRAISLEHVFCIFIWTSSLFIRWHTPPLSPRERSSC